MIYVMSDKFFLKNVKKLVKYKEYFIIDGSNFAVTGYTDEKHQISGRFSNCHTVGAFCPDKYFFEILHNKYKKEKYNKKKYKLEKEEYIKGERLAVAIITTIKAFVGSNMSSDTNIFVVLPKEVYKALAKSIIKKFYKMSKVDFEFIVDIKEIGDNFKALKGSISKKEINKLKPVINKLEKKYKFYETDDD